MTTEGPASYFTGTTTLRLDEDDTDSKVLAFDFKVGSKIFSAADVTLTTLNLGADQLISIGTVTGTGYPIVDGTDSFTLIFARNGSFGASFGYAQAGSDGIFGYGDGYVTVESIITPVPEPASWAMMLAGFAMTALALRRTARRRNRIAASLHASRAHNARRAHPALSFSKGCSPSH